MAQYEFFLASSLEKVFPTRRPTALIPDAQLSAWRGTRASVQLVYRVDDLDTGYSPQAFDITIEGSPCASTIRSVELMPSDFPCYAQTDDHYITKDPGLFPDLLAPKDDARIIPLPNQYRSLWITWQIPEDTAPGTYKISINAHAVEHTTLHNGVHFSDPSVAGLKFECSITLCVGKAQLPAQTLLHTEWFHADCLASYYHTEPLSEKHWRILENFIRAAAQEHGINMLLTPVITPALDTAVGHERPTVQLVDVFLDNGNYHFSFENLARWTTLCKKYGVTHLEISHLFTQWGAQATPKVVAAVDGVKKRIFGWDVPATSREYRKFLEAFLPALRTALEDMGFDRDHVYYHISDEPSAKHLDDYRAAKAQAEDLLGDCQVIDALSSLEFYKQNLVRQPIPSNDHIQAFFDANVPDLWVYYCCAQGNLVPNRFFSMESARNRIMGVLMYLYRIKGFLHWGYNFYYSQYSLKPINPYEVTHAGYAFPSGDAFLVYPGKDGQPLSSLRAEAQNDALLDLRALQLLEKLAGAELVNSLIYENSGLDTMTFTNYPQDAEYLLNLREKVALEIEKHS